MTKEQRPTLEEWVYTENRLEKHDLMKYDESMDRVDIMEALSDNSDYLIQLISDYLEAHKEPVEEEPKENLVWRDGDGGIVLRYDLEFGKGVDWEGKELMALNSIGRNGRYLAWPAGCSQKNWSLYREQDGGFVFEEFGTKSEMEAAANKWDKENLTPPKDKLDKLPEVGKRYKETILNRSKKVASIDMYVKVEDFGLIKVSEFWNDFKELPDQEPTKENTVDKEPNKATESKKPLLSKEALWALSELKKDLKAWKKEVFKVDKKYIDFEMNLCTREIFDTLVKTQNLVTALEARQDKPEGEE